MMTATLRETVSTPLGAYGPGTQVHPIRKVDDGIQVCLDPVASHLGRRCHTVTIPRAALLVTVTTGGWDVGAA